MCPEMRHRQPVTLLGSSTRSSHSAYSGARPCRASSNFAWICLRRSRRGRRARGRRSRGPAPARPRCRRGRPRRRGRAPRGRCRARRPGSRGRAAIWMTDLRLIPSRIEERVPRRHQLALADDEDVLARALADEPVLVEQDRLVEAGLRRLGLRQDRVQVLAGGLRVRDQARRARSAARRRPWRGCRCACPPRRGRRPRARRRSSRRPAPSARTAPSRRSRGRRAGGCSSCRGRCGGSARGSPRGAPRARRPSGR